MSAGAVDVREPWQMTREQWDAERERLRPGFVQAQFTKASASEAVGRHERLHWLLFGVHADASRRLNAAGRGEIHMSPDEAAELLDQINTPVSYDDVIARAQALGLIAAQEARRHG